MSQISSEIELTTDNEREILGMAGPWVADISVRGEFLSKDCVLDNFIYNQDKNLLFFVKFNKGPGYYQYFSIGFYNLESKVIGEFDREFDMVHIGEFASKNELEIYPAFHDQFKNTRQIFDIDAEEFHLISD